MPKNPSTMEHDSKKFGCEDCFYYHQNDPDYPDNCEYPDNPPCNEELPV